MNGQSGIVWLKIQIMLRVSNRQKNSERVHRVVVWEKSMKNQKDPQNRCKYALEGTLASSRDLEIDSSFKSIDQSFK